MPENYLQKRCIKKYFTWSWDIDDHSLKGVVSTKKVGWKFYIILNWWKNDWWRSRGQIQVLLIKSRIWQFIWSLSYCISNLTLKRLSWSSIWPQINTVIHGKLHAVALQYHLKIWRCPINHGSILKHRWFFIRKLTTLNLLTVLSRWKKFHSTESQMIVLGSSNLTQVWYKITET